MEIPQQLAQPSPHLYLSQWVSLRILRSICTPTLQPWETGNLINLESIEKEGLEVLAKEAALEPQSSEATPLNTTRVAQHLDESYEEEDLVEMVMTSLDSSYE